MKYNAAGYNEQRYNINGTFHASAFSEAMTATEDYLPGRLLFDSFTLTDDLLGFGIDVMLVDALFLEDAIRVDFLNKALGDSIRMSDWLSIRRYPFANNWTN